MEKESLFEQNNSLDKGTASPGEFFPSGVAGGEGNDDLQHTFDEPISGHEIDEALIGITKNVRFAPEGAKSTTVQMSPEEYDRASEIYALRTGEYKQYRDIMRLVESCKRSLKKSELHRKNIEKEGDEEAVKVDNFFQEYVKNADEIKTAVNDEILQTKMKTSKIHERELILASILDDLTKEAEEIQEKFPAVERLWQQDDPIKLQADGYDVHTPVEELNKKILQLISDKENSMESGQEGSQNGRVANE